MGVHEAGGHFEGGQDLPETTTAIASSAGGLAIEATVNVEQPHDEEYYRNNFGISEADASQEVVYGQHKGTFGQMLTDPKCPVGANIREAFKNGGNVAVDEKIQALSAFLPEKIVVQREFHVEDKKPTSLIEEKVSSDQDIEEKVVDEPQQVRKIPAEVENSMYKTVDVRVLDAASTGTKIIREHKEKPPTAQTTIKNPESTSLVKEKKIKKYKIKHSQEATSYKQKMNPAETLVIPTRKPKKQLKNNINVQPIKLGEQEIREIPSQGRSAIRPAQPRLTIHIEKVNLDPADDANMRAIEQLPVGVTTLLPEASELITGVDTDEIIENNVLLLADLSYLQDESEYKTDLAVDPYPEIGPRPIATTSTSTQLAERIESLEPIIAGEARQILMVVEKKIWQLQELTIAYTDEENFNTTQLKAELEQELELFVTRLVVCMGIEPDAETVQDIIHCLRNEDGMHERKPHVSWLWTDLDDLLKTSPHLIGRWVLQFSALKVHGTVPYLN